MKLLVTALAALLTPSLAFAQTDPGEVGYILTTFLFLFGAVLVFWMHAGFAFLETGLVRSKNATMQMTKNLGLFCVSSIMFLIVGFNLMYPGDAWTIPGMLGAFGITSLDPVGLENAKPDLSYASAGSDFLFQLMFCGATASIVSGAVAERIKLWSFLVFAAVLTGILYPIQGSWVWGGGFLAEAGFADVAGSTLVHSFGGWAALTGIWILGARTGKYKNGRVNPFPGSNLPLAFLGTFILWMGWFGFNGASKLSMASAADIADISRIMANTHAAAVAGGLVALIMTAVSYGKPDLTMAMNGALGGLVAITAEPLYPSLLTASVIGGLGAVIVVLAVPLLDRFKLDDVVGAVPVHLCAGIFGTLVVPMTNPGATFGAQIYGVVVIGAFSIITSTIVWFVIKATLGLREDAEAEITGLDVTELGMESYPEFQNS